VKAQNGEMLQILVLIINIVLLNGYQGLFLLGRSDTDVELSTQLLLAPGLNSEL
jgi:hypothetical protein